MAAAEMESSGGTGDTGGVRKTCWGWMWGRREDKDKRDAKVFVWLGTPSSEEGLHAAWESGRGSGDGKVMRSAWEVVNCPTMRT